MTPFGMKVRELRKTRRITLKKMAEFPPSETPRSRQLRGPVIGPITTGWMCF